MAASASSAPLPRAAARILIGLLALAIFINALDRGTFATAAPLIKDEFGLTNAQVGVLLSAYFWTYVPGHLLAGWLAERINAYRTLAIGLALWSVATVLIGFGGGFAALLLLRLLLGLGESAGFPASSKLLALHMPQHRLASANAQVGAGLMLGNGAGVLLGGLLIARFGWHALFFVFGGLSLLWLLPWTLFTRRLRPAASHPAAGGAAPSFAAMLRQRALWGAAIGHFAGNYPYFMVLAWLPLYLVKQQGWSIDAMAWLGGLVYLLSAVFGLIGGRVADRWIARSGSLSRVRKTMMIASSAVALVCMLACASGSPRLAVAGLVGYSLSNGLGAFSVFSIGQTLAGPRAAGKWMGVQNGFAGLAGVLGPIVTGLLIDATGNYRAAFLIAAAAAALAIVCWGFVVRRVEPIVWSEL